MTLPLQSNREIVIGLPKHYDNDCPSSLQKIFQGFTPDSFLYRNYSPILILKSRHSKLGLNFVFSMRSDELSNQDIFLMF